MDLISDILRDELSLRFQLRPFMSLTYAPMTYRKYKCASNLTWRKAQESRKKEAYHLQWQLSFLRAHDWNGKTGDATMAKSVSTRSVKSKAAFSSLRSRAVKKRSVSFPSAKPTLEKLDAIVSISVQQARAAKADWAKIDKTTEKEIARQVREDAAAIPSNRKWRELIQAGHLRVVPPTVVDVRAIRKKLHLSQSAFAERFGFTAASVRQWEQGRRQPHGPARVLLTVIDREPMAVYRALLASE